MVSAAAAAWKLLPEGRADRDWDETISALPDHCVFQSSSWARHKAASGWTPLRLLACAPDGSPLAAVQVLRRPYPGAQLLWSRGGPLGDPALWGQGLRAALKPALGRRPAYWRVCCYREEGPGPLEAMARNGWTRPARPLDGGGSFLLDLGGSDEELAAGLSSNWGHNLRRGLKRCPAVRVWADPDPAEMARIYRELEAYKGLPSQHSAGDLASLLRHLGAGLALMRADGEDGRPVALRACAVQGDKAWDLLAASSEEGRRVYASYALLWKLFARCRALGVRSYDLGGADALGARGVHDFKKGTGARPIRYLGEWDWADPSLLRRPAGLAIALWKSGAP